MGKVIQLFSSPKALKKRLAELEKREEQVENIISVRCKAEIDELNEIDAERTKIIKQLKGA